MSGPPSPSTVSVAALPPCSGDVSSMNRDNPLYESQEIRMEMFADVSEEEEEGSDCHVC